MIAVELVKPGTTEPNPELAKAAAAHALSRGVVVLTCGTYGNVLRLLPPMVIDDDLLCEGLQILDEALTPA
jgi:4-aminobutyrate aminotransferase/(S)-3-amino-2-methylpropionate transaminase